MTVGREISPKPSQHVSRARLLWGIGAVTCGVRANLPRVGGAQVQYEGTVERWISQRNAATGRGCWIAYVFDEP